ncbi:Hypothetical protein A7982_08156 [Minicystis rosea]|nr:Hypothetical protein A7982_08156 [Minicystis rosea]
MTTAADSPPDAIHLRDLGARWAIVIWGVGGVLALLAQALFKLTPFALEPLVFGPLSFGQAVLYAAWVVTNAYMEGYRGFHKRFSPRVVSRAFHLATRPRPSVVHVVLAPFFVMSLLHANRRGLTTAWLLVLGLTAVVAVVRHLQQPWRGIVDGGVVVGLTWGAASLLVHLVAAARAGRAAPPSDLPS